MVDRPSAATGSPFTVATSRTSAVHLALPAAHAQAVTVDDRAPTLANDPEMGLGVGGHLELVSMIMASYCEKAGKISRAFQGFSFRSAQILVFPKIRCFENFPIKRERR